MQVVHEFSRSLKVGEKGEEHVLEYLRRSGNVQNILDVRDSKPYQVMDVDFLVTLNDGMEYKVEVKTDTYLSGNIYYETISSLEHDSVGCLEKTKADFLFYYYLNAGSLYIFSMPEYKEWFTKKKPYFDHLGYQKRPVNRGRGKNTYTSVGYAFPISILEDDNPRWMRKVYVNF